MVMVQGAEGGASVSFALGAAFFAFAGVAFFAFAGVAFFALAGAGEPALSSRCFSRASSSALVFQP